MKEENNGSAPNEISTDQLGNRLEVRREAVLHLSQPLYTQAS